LRLPSRAIPLIIAGAVAIGILLGSTIFAGFVSGSINGKASQSLNIGGIETIKVIGPDGKTVSFWQGRDPLTRYAINAIVGCITGTNGGTTTPNGFGSCNTWVSSTTIFTADSSATCVSAITCATFSATVTNYVTPNGCDPASPLIINICSGWQSQAIFPPTTQWPTACGSSGCGLENVDLYGGVTSTLFDELCSSGYGEASCTVAGSPNPLATVSPGDTLVVTISFTVT
jgi:hypothetical protein